mgnify:CR=1 FL=1
MHALIFSIALILKLLIFIGDAVILIFKYPTKVIVKAFVILSGRFKKKRKRRKVVRIFPPPVGIKIKYILTGSLFSLIFVFIPLLIIIFLEELPSPKQLSSQQSPLTTKIYDRNGILLYQIYINQNRTLVPLSSIPKYLKEATIAIEDKNFYKNSGFDTLAIIRSIIANLSGKPLQGGSTITQQLIKSTLLTPEVSIQRKIKEIILAFWAEKIYTKDQILEMYFNQVPYGGTAWGVEAASEIYFGKSVTKLSLAESSLLAGLPRAPSLYSPHREYPTLWKKRQKEVLSRMKDLRYITKQQQVKTEKEKITILPMLTPIYAPHFVMYVKDFLTKKYGLALVEKGGLKVITSLDLNLQKIAQNIVADEVQENAYLNLTNGAALITNPKNGDILAMVGSKDYDEKDVGNFNVTTGLRQPGSSIKVVTYSAALSQGLTAATPINDSPITFTLPNTPSYSPVNYDGRFHGTLTLRMALANSINIPAVKTLAKISIPTMVALAKKMGITTWGNPDNYGLAVTLGAAEAQMTDMATVYGVLANGGYRVDLNPIEKITDSQGNILEEKKDVTKKWVLDPGISFIISNILADNNARALEFGTNSPLYIPKHVVSVKTGTSDNKRDNWTIGYTPSFVVATWVGNNDNSPMSPSLTSGITGAAPIWNKIMSSLLTGKKDEKPTSPSNVIEKLCLGRIEYFIIGTENSVNCILRPTPSPTPKH